MSAKSKTTETGKPAPTFNEIMDKAAKSAIRGGTAGAVAMGANVACLMWMRTTVSLVYIYERYFFFSNLLDKFTHRSIAFLLLALFFPPM